MSNPNTMIDQGQTRNAIYSVEISDFDNQQDLARSMAYIQFLHRDNSKNHNVYSFGGRSTVKSVIPKKGMHNDFLESTASSIPKSDYIVYFKDPLQKVNDYTKNISQSIFSPCLLPADRPTKETVKRTTKLMTTPSKSLRSASTASTLRSKKSGSRQDNDKLRTIETMLNEESSKKRKLQKELKVVREDIDRFKALLK